MLALGLAGDAPAADETAPNGPIDLERARELFELAEHLSDVDGGAMWGRELYGPILLVDPGTRATVSNDRDKDGVLAPIADGLFAGRLPEELAIGNTTTQWAGRRWTMVMWPLPHSAVGAGTLLMHECFHRIQPDLGIPLAAPRNEHLATPEGRFWLRLEWRALGAALDADAPLESEALADAFLFRRERQRRFKEAMKEERALLLNEGLAEYTGQRLGGGDEADMRRRASAALRSYEGMPRLTRMWAYASGPPYALLLDRARPGWREDVTERTDLPRTLERAVRYRQPKRIADAAAERGDLYGGAELRAEEEAKAGERQAKLDDLRARFVDGPRLGVAIVGGSSYSFGPHQIEELPGVGTVYGSLRISGPWGILDAQDGALMVRGTRRRPTVVYVPAPDDPDARPAVGAGWTLTLNDGWTVVPDGRAGDYAVVRASERRSGPRVRP